MKTIYRAEIPVDDTTHTITMGKDDRILKVANSGIAEVEFWFLTDTDELRIGRSFRVYGTGHEIPEHSRYAGTAPRNRGLLVWHLFEMTS